MWIISVTSRNCAIHLLRDLGGCGRQGERFSCQTTKYKHNKMLWDIIGIKPEHFQYLFSSKPLVLPEAFWECNDLKMLEFFK